MTHREIWDSFAAEMRVAEEGVPLFRALSDGTVVTKLFGTTRIRPVLSRSEAMETLLRREAGTVVADWECRTREYDGLVYLMFQKSGNEVLPLYIGKAETLGKSGNLSANMQRLATDTSKFARWGDNYAYHIGDLSAVVLPGHEPSRITAKYRDWARALFIEFPTPSPRLKREVFFWAKAWRPDYVGIWRDFGRTRLSFLEYLMIGVASSAFPALLLNREGQNRCVDEVVTF
jgi:hypothetical protein